MATELAIIEPSALVPTEVFAPGGIDTILGKLEADVRAAAAELDISTSAGRKAIASLAYQVARSKTALDEMGKELVAETKAKVALIDADRRTVRERLDKLRDEVREPLDEYEAAERARVDRHEAAIWRIEQLTVSLTAMPPTDVLAERLQQAHAVDTSGMQEFTARAEKAKASAVERLTAMLAESERRDAERAELERLRREAAERERCEEIIAGFDHAHEFGDEPNTADISRRLERIEQTEPDVSEPYRERAAAAKAGAVQRLGEMLAAARQAEREREERIRQEAAEKARREAEEAAERQRVAAERAAAEERAKAEREKAEADERAAQAERERQEAERRAKEAAERAERDRIAAEERHAQEVEAAARRERERIEQERQAEDEARRKREADRAHRAAVNNAAVAALVAAGLSDGAAKVAVTAIAKGDVPRVSIAY